MTVGERVSDWRERGLNWSLVGWIVLIVGPVVLLYNLGVEQRFLSMVLGFLASFGLTFRLLTTWTRTSVLVHAVSALIITNLLLGAIAQAQIIASGVALSTYVGWPLILLRCACILVAVKWPRWLDRRYSPLLASPPRREFRS